jgi:1-acyl-sn-glycerol-3-phosphate acyltransferase
VGQAFKILGFPMMKRHSKSEIAKNPALKHRDILEARKSCEQLLSQPFTLLNYVEGTVLRLKNMLSKNHLTSIYSNLKLAVWH